MDVSRVGPFGRIQPPVQHVLPLEQVNPVIRIAHRMMGPVNIPERVIVDHELVLIVAGQGTLQRRGAETPFKPGTLLFIRPFVPHAFHSTGARGEHMAVHFDFRANVPPRGRDLSKRSPYAVRLTGGVDLPGAVECRPQDAVYQAMTAIVNAGPAGAPLADLARRAHLLRILAKLLSRPKEVDDTDGATSDARNTARLDRAIAAMSARLAEPWDAEQLAAVAGLSPSHFTRLFRQHTGRTPMAHLRHRRVDAARSLLANVDLSIKEIAVQCGFDDPYHFSKVFHQIDGLSPSVYREALLAGRVNPRRTDEEG